MNFKCAPCLDELLGAGSDYQGGPEVPDAVTMAPVMQVMNVQGRQIPVPVVIPVCVACRKVQLGAPASRTGLVVA